MMRCSPFDFYSSSGYPDHYYYGYQPSYARSYGFGHPFVDRMPYRRHEHQFGMPVEIPITYEGSDASTTTQRESCETKKPRIPEEERVGPNMMARTETQKTTEQTSPKSLQKQPLSKPGGKTQVPMNDVESPVNKYDDEFPFYPETSSEFHEDEFPFGFPFLASSRTSPFTNVPVTKATSRKAAAAAGKSAPNKSAEKSTRKKTTATMADQQHSDSDKMQQVPVVKEEAQHAYAQEQPKLPAKQPLTAEEQLENIKKEMEITENRIDNFIGDRKDKEYIILDEMMTSLLLRLDMIESDGVEEIRNKRRQLVRHIQEYVQKLECKVGIVSPTEEKKCDETEMMEDEDAEKKSKEVTEPEVADVVMNTQDTAEELTLALNLDGQAASGHHDIDQSLELEGKMQRQLDETFSSLQEMVVDKSEIDCNCTSQTEVNSDVENRTLEEMMPAGDISRTTGVDTNTD